MSSPNVRLPAAMAALALLAGGCGLFGGDDDGSYQAELEPLNDSGAEGSVTIEVDGDAMTVAVATTGMSPGLPHAQHLHLGGDGECPSPDDTGDDEVVSTVDGQPFYGEIAVSLTTEGDVGPDSGLAVERFPVAGDDGAVAYSRTIQLPDGFEAEDLEDVVVVQHGISELVGDEAQYDGPFDSPLNPDLPLEATVPALCGELDD